MALWFFDIVGALDLALGPRPQLLPQRKEEHYSLDAIMHVMENVSQKEK